MEYKYNAIVERIIDADTVELTVILLSEDRDLGFHIRHRAYEEVTEIFRLADIDAFERSDIGGPAAKAAIEELMPVGELVHIQTDKDPKGGFGRWRAHIYTTEGVYVNAALVEEGHAVWSRK